MTDARPAPLDDVVDLDLRGFKTGEIAAELTARWWRAEPGTARREALRALIGLMAELVDEDRQV